MEVKDIILISGIVVAGIWLGVCVVIEGKARKWAIIAGALLDIIFFAICKNCDFLMVGMLGGLACGIIPVVSRRKHQQAVKEFHGVWNWTVVSVIFFVMIFMVIALVYPNIRIEWGN